MVTGLTMEPSPLGSPHSPPRSSPVELLGPRRSSFLNWESLVRWNSPRTWVALTDPQVFRFLHKMEATLLCQLEALFSEPCKYHRLSERHPLVFIHTNYEVRDTIRSQDLLVVTVFIGPFSLDLLPRSLPHRDARIRGHMVCRS
jgi:hypothetical protein